MMESLEQLRAELAAAVAGAGDLAALEEARVAALGKKGRITGLMKTLGGLSPEERRDAGAALNALKDEISAAIDARRRELERAALDARLEAERVDITLPARPEPRGHLHPISQTIDELIAIFGDMGFSVAEGPDIEDDFHNFTALNFPPGHPAREMHDTFYLPEGEDGTPRLLRTHTSPVQVRTMMGQKPPIRVIIPGRTYRSDHDMTHTPMFHQVEGLVIDESTNMGHLKGCLIEFCRAFFGIDDLPLRFRPSFFPFTEPSAEVDIWFENKKGGPGWVEWGGCGMVNPNVLRACGIDPEEYSGFAFGMGLERTLQFRNGIPDMRDMVEGDVRFSLPFGVGI